MGTNGKDNINSLRGRDVNLSDDIETVTSARLQAFPSADRCIRGLDLSGLGAPDQGTLTKSSGSPWTSGVAASKGHKVNVRAVLERINNEPRIVYYRIY